MSTPLNLLIIEDNNPADFRLILRHLEKHGLAARCHSVSNIKELETAVAQGGWDAVLSDYSVPMLDFKHTLGLLQAQEPDLPLILVSGSIGEEKAVELLKLGVWDFVLKDSLTRLVSAIERSLRDAASRRERRAAEAALHESEEQFRAMFELASIGMAQADPYTGHWLRVNQKVCEITGYSAEELLQLRIEEITHPEDRQKDAEAFQRVIRDETPNYRIEKRFLRKGGVVAWANVNMTVIRDAAGQPTRTMATIEDITDRKRAETYREMGREVLQILIQPGDLKDSIQRLLAVFMTRTGFDAVGIRLQDGEDFPYFTQEGFPEDFLQTENTLMGRAADSNLRPEINGKVCLECSCGLVISDRTDPANPLFTPGGSCWTNDTRTLLDIPADEDPRHHPRNRCVHYGYSSTALVPIRTRDSIVGLVQLNDRRKGCFTLETIEILEGIAAHIGESLMRKKAEMECNEARLHAEAANQAKSEFLGIMSHELRTPLNGVLGSAELLTYTSLDEEQNSLVELVRKCGEHLLAIVKDILDFSSIEAGKLALDVAPMTVTEVVEQSALIVKTSSAEKGLTFRCETSRDVPHQITSDALRISQILINLLSNAVKFTSSGSVVLRVAPDAERRFLDFSVEDTGIGISPETIGLLFKPFTQVDSTSTRAFGGTGLGLAISKRLAETMGGSITVASIPGKGSTFTFHHPLESATFSASGMTSVPPPILDWERKKSVQQQPPSPVQMGEIPRESHPVLVVEDDPENRMLAGKMLRSLGYRAEFAADGGAAVEAFVPGKYVAILMDVVMPGMSGMEATRKIRQLEAKSGSHVPIITLTANVMPGDRDQYLAAGMDEFLSKPFKRGELASVLARETGSVGNS